ncbi:hypothetical protein Ae201684_006282 [Aphanomyces euteiches]|uniref:Uncharacterized protein n=1 Tax=Aphanomyces euteiches TaxID=100861 RepID=A0A6G0XCB1_9STRA|nr:hypothetical protein Ae201684_006282 [Aphanomyces euteiches]
MSSDVSTTRLGLILSISSALDCDWQRFSNSSVSPDRPSAEPKVTGLSVHDVLGDDCRLCRWHLQLVWQRECVVAFGREQVQGDKFLDGLWLWDGKLVLRVWNDLSRPEDLHGSKTKTMLLQRHFQASHDASLLLLGRFCIVQPAPQ